MPKNKNIIKPCKSYVVIESKKIEAKTSFGLIIPEQEDKKPEIGTVIGVGEAVEDKSIKEGVDVIFNKHVPYRVEVDGKKYLIIEWREILATITEN